MSITRQLEHYIPPGIIFVVQALSLNILPIVGISYALLTVTGNIFTISLPRHVFWAILFASVPTIYILNIFVHETRKRLGARAIHAALPPTWDGKLPGNYDILKQSLDVISSGYIGEFHAKIFQELGNFFNLRIFWRDLYFTIEPEHVKQILATDFYNFEKGHAFKYGTKSLLGTGVFNSDDEMWKFHRSITRPFFSRERISDFELFSHHADTIIEQMVTRLRQGHAVDFQDAVARFTLDSATEFLFGSCVNSAKVGLPYPGSGQDDANRFTGNAADKFARAFMDAQWNSMIRVRIGYLWPLVELAKNKMKAPMDIVNAYLDPILAAALQRRNTYLLEKNAYPNVAQLKASEKNEILEGETLLDYLVKQTNDPEILKDETLNILLAGRDTTAATLTFAVYLLSQHPHVLKRLRSEILETVGTDRVPNLEDIRRMKYLRAVINEMLRLYPPVPFNSRTAIKATTLPPVRPGGKPIYVPAGTRVTYSVFIMHRRLDLWGPDAMEFDPDRFIDERLQKYLIPNPFIFVPFNAGPRICLGQQFAYNETSFMLIRLFQTFDTVSFDKVSQPPESKPPSIWKKAGGRQAKEELVPKSHLTMYAHKGLWIRMTEANVV